MKIVFIVVNLSSDSRTINGDFTEYYTSAMYLTGDYRSGKLEWTENISRATIFNTKEEALTALGESEPILKWKRDEEIYTVWEVYMRN